MFVNRDEAGSFATRAVPHDVVVIPFRHVVARWRRHATPPGEARPRHPSELAEYNTRDARDLFSHLLYRVRGGEQIVIAHAGRPIAKLVPYSGKEPRRPGVVRAQIVFHDDTRKARDA